MTTKKDGKKVRVTLDLRPEFHDRLAQLAEALGVDAKADVIKQALQLYEYVAAKWLAGYTFRAVASDGREENIVFLGPISSVCPERVSDSILLDQVERKNESHNPLPHSPSSANSAQ